MERETLHNSDDQKRIAIVDTKTYDGGVVGSPVIVIRYQLGNHLGSCSLELDDSANIISYEEFHPFGTSAYRLGSTSTEVSLKRYRYVGKERDEESGLYYYGARYYAAWLGRFVSVDALKDDYPMWSTYRNSSNNPVIFYDLDGMERTNTTNSKNTTNGQNQSANSNMTYSDQAKKSVRSNSVSIRMSK